jgi:NADH-quinone oxidoreductase subunit G
MPTFKLDDRVIEFQPGETIIQAAHRAGVDIPHYCWHPGLSVAANCRMCLVELAPPPGRAPLMLDVLRYDEKTGEYVKARKPKLVPACQQGASDGLEVKSQTSAHVAEARAAVQELLLLNHPVDCPICDQAGECRLQDYWLEHGATKKRMNDEPIHKPKAVDFGPTIVYDAERCIVCTRCVRFCEEVALDPVLDKRERGNLSEIVLAPGRQLDHAYTLMTEHVCPVGALTAKDFRFKARVWFLRSARTVCVGCATGCNSYTDFDPRNQTVYRYRPRENAQVNKFWMCDEGMLDYRRIHAGRVLQGRVRGERTTCEAALDAAAETLSKLDPAKSAVVFSAQHSSEDNYALLALAGQLGIDRFFISGRPEGEGDNILRSEDKNPNRTGVISLCGLNPPKSSRELADAAGAGILDTVLVLGSYAEVPELTPALSRIKTVVALATHEGPFVDVAKVVLPASSWAECDGTFVNRDGITQQSDRAITPRGDSQPAWKLVSALSKRLGKNVSFKKVSEVQAALGLRPEGTTASATQEAGASA